MPDKRPVNASALSRFGDFRGWLGNIPHTPWSASTTTFDHDMANSQSHTRSEVRSNKSSAASTGAQEALQISSRTHERPSMYNGQQEQPAKRRKTSTQVPIARPIDLESVRLSTQHPPSLKPNSSTSHALSSSKAHSSITSHSEKPNTTSSKTSGQVISSTHRRVDSVPLSVLQRAAAAKRDVAKNPGLPQAQSDNRALANVSQVPVLKAPSSSVVPRSLLTDEKGSGSSRLSQGDLQGPLSTIKTSGYAHFSAVPQKTTSTKNPQTTLSRNQACPPFTQDVDDDSDASSDCVFLGERQLSSAEIAARAKQIGHHAPSMRPIKTEPRHGIEKEVAPPVSTQPKPPDQQSCEVSQITAHATLRQSMIAPQCNKTPVPGTQVSQSSAAEIQITEKESKSSGLHDQGPVTAVGQSELRTFDQHSCSIPPGIAGQAQRKESLSVVAPAEAPEQTQALSNTNAQTSSHQERPPLTAGFQPLSAVRATMSGFQFPKPGQLPPTPPESQPHSADDVQPHRSFRDGPQLEPFSSSDEGPRSSRSPSASPDHGVPSDDIPERHRHPVSLQEHFRMQSTITPLLSAAPPASSRGLTKQGYLRLTPLEDHITRLRNLHKSKAEIFDLCCQKFPIDCSVEAFESAWREVDERRQPGYTKKRQQPQKRPRGQTAAPRHPGSRVKQDPNSDVVSTSTAAPSRPNRLRPTVGGKTIPEDWRDRYARELRAQSISDGESAAADEDVMEDVQVTTFFIYTVWRSEHRVDPLKPDDENEQEDSDHPSFKVSNYESLAEANNAAVQELHKISPTSDFRMDISDGFSMHMEPLQHGMQQWTLTAEDFKIKAWVNRTLHHRTVPVPLSDSSLLFGSELFMIHERVEDMAVDDLFGEPVPDLQSQHAGQPFSQPSRRNSGSDNRSSGKADSVDQHQTDTEGEIFTTLAHANKHAASRILELRRPRCINLDEMDLLQARQKESMHQLLTELERQSEKFSDAVDIGRGRIVKIWVEGLRVRGPRN